MPSSIGNFFVKAIVNSPLHPLLGKGFAVLTFTGRKSGKPFSTPVNVVWLDGALTILSMRSRTWWRNLRDGRTAQLRHAGKTTTVRGEVLESTPEVTAGLALYFARFPTHAKYFNLRLAADGQPLPAALERAALGRVLIRLRPAEA